MQEREAVAAPGALEAEVLAEAMVLAEAAAAPLQMMKITILKVEAEEVVDILLLKL